jgi:hypothetical protein
VLFRDYYGDMFMLDMLAHMMVMFLGLFG